MSEDSRIGENDANVEKKEEIQSLPGIKTVSGLVLVTMLILLVIGSVAQAWHFEFGMFITQWLLILPPALWFWKRYNVDRKQFARIKPLEKKFLPAISLLVICAWLLNMLLAVVLVSFLMGFGYQPLEILPPPSDLGQYFVYLAVIAVSAAICEEVLFRGTVMPSLERYGTLPALVFSSLLFAVFHLTFLNFLSALILGLLIGLVVIKTGSILAGIYYHFLNNTLAVTYLYLFSDLEPETTAEASELAELSLPLFIIMMPALAGLLFALKKINNYSTSPPILTGRQGWLPKGWFNGLAMLALLIFLLVAFAEMLLGFGML